MVSLHARSRVVLAAALLLLGCGADRRSSEPITPDAPSADGGSQRDRHDAALDPSVDEAANAPPEEPEPEEEWVKPADRPCSDGDLGMDTPLIRATTVGADESRTDFCDENGNLIDHTCEQIEFADHLCGCEGECNCGYQVTGRILEEPYDCKGDCVDGACQSWCPDQDDSLSIALAAGGLLHVENLTKARHYMCRPQVNVPEAGCRELESYQGTQTSAYGYRCFGPDPVEIHLQRPPAPPSTGDTWKCPFECTRVEGP